MSMIDQIINVESGGNPNAKNPRSTATGPGQFIESTWLNILPKYRPDITTGLGRDEILALRTDPQLSRQMTEALAAENASALTKAGFQATPGNTYLAHFAGPQGALNVLGANPSDPVSSILGESVVKANPFLANMTAGDLAAWANNKMGQSSPSMAATPINQTVPQNDQSTPNLAPAVTPEAQQNPMAMMRYLAQFDAPPNQLPQMGVLEPPNRRGAFRFSGPLRGAFSFGRGQWLKV
jgi:hypothetical protein